MEVSRGILIFSDEKKVTELKYLPEALLRSCDVLLESFFNIMVCTIDGKGDNGRDSKEKYSIDNNEWICLMQECSSGPFEIVNATFSKLYSKLLTGNITADLSFSKNGNFGLIFPVTGIYVSDIHKKVAQLVSLEVCV